MPFSFSSLFRPKNDFNKTKAFLSHHIPLHGSDVRCCCEKGLISVILPVYNCEKYLEESILSVLSQTYTNLELIIVNDGSEDDSGKIADSFLARDQRISVIHQKNMTLPAALNNGFAAARGEFLTWTSADNRMLPVCLEILAEELSRDRRCDMVFGNMRLIDENGDTLKGKGWYEIPPLSGNVILPDSTESLNTYANNTIGAAFLYRSGAAAVLNGYSEYQFMLEDSDYFMRMNSLFSIKHIIYKKPIYEYRMHNDSLTSHDEELGITASRPAMMELDKFRREFYTKDIYFYADGKDDEIISALLQTCRRIYNIEKAEKLASQSPCEIFYVNTDNSKSTWENKKIPRFLVLREPTTGAYGYDAMICKNAASLHGNPGWICTVTSQTAASFMILRAKNDVLYKYEGNN